MQEFWRELRLCETACLEINRSGQADFYVSGRGESERR